MRYLHWLPSAEDPIDAILARVRTTVHQIPAVFTLIVALAHWLYRNVLHRPVLHWSVLTPAPSVGPLQTSSLSLASQQTEFLPAISQGRSRLGPGLAAGKEAPVRVRGGCAGDLATVCDQSEGHGLGGVAQTLRRMRV
jgi:hypothetical protein